MKVFLTAVIIMMIFGFFIGARRSEEIRDIRAGATSVNRFDKIYQESSGNEIRSVLIDRETGRQYLLFQRGYSSAITLMPEPHALDQ